MLNVGDSVLHQTSGNLGKVIGYGHEIRNGVFLPTLKVRILQAKERSYKGFIEEDLSSVWLPVQEG